MDTSIIPECYADTCLVETLVPPQKRYNHQKGCPNVAKTMRNNFKDSFAVGIIDKDKREIEYAKEFELLVETPNQLQLLKHPQKHHYLIYVCPAFEKWVLQCAAEAEVNLADFDVPSDIDGLKDFAKREMGKDDKEYKAMKRVFRELINKNSSSAIQLQNWITHLKNNNYKTDIEALKQL